MRCNYVDAFKLPIELIQEYLSACELRNLRWDYVDNTTHVTIKKLTQYIHAQYTQISTSLFGELDEERRCVGKGQRVMGRGGMSSALEPLDLDCEIREINVSHSPLLSTHML